MTQINLTLCFLFECPKCVTPQNIYPGPGEYVNRVKCSKCEAVFETDVAAAIERWVDGDPTEPSEGWRGGPDGES